MQQNSFFPRSHFAQIKIMKFTDIICAFFDLLLLGSILISISVFFSQRWLTASLFLLFGIMSIVPLLLVHYYYEKNAIQQLYQFPCTIPSAEIIASSINAKKLNKNSYFSSIIVDGINYDISVFKVDLLSAKSQKEKNAQMQHRFSEKNLVPIYSVRKKARINIMVCRNVEKQYLHSLAKNVRHLLDRNECILYAIFCENDHIVYIPQIFDELDYLQIKRYEKFCEIITTICRDTAGDG